MPADQLTVAERGVIVSAVLAFGLKCPQFEAQVNGIFAKLGLTEAAREVFDHYKAKAEARRTQS